MTLLRAYLVIYYTLLIGAAVTLRRSGVLDRVPSMWIAVVVVVAVGLGLVLAMTTTRDSSQKTSLDDENKQ
jgi:hypothetical protein